MLPAEQIKDAKALAARLLASDSLTDTPEAEQLWRLLSSGQSIPTGEAARIYRLAGYVPFVGFPLTRTKGH